MPRRHRVRRQLRCDELEVEGQLGAELGGPGAVFWMWITALVGMATKFSEAVLAVRYRQVDEAGEYDLWGRLV